MSKQYYENLGHDLTVLEIGWQIPGQNTDHIDHYGDLCDLIGSTQFIGHESQTALSELPNLPAMATALGRRILWLQDQHANFDGDDNCCGEAEWRLLVNMSTASTANPARVSPVILTSRDKPVGIIKGYGERTCYGLATVLTHGIVKGAFSSLHEDTIFDPYRIPGTRTAWHMPIDSIPGLMPVRFSIFGVPVHERRYLDYSSDLESRALRTPHEAIKRRASVLLQQARPVERTLLEQSA